MSERSRRPAGSRPGAGNRRTPTERATRRPASSRSTSGAASRGRATRRRRVRGFPLGRPERRTTGIFVVLTALMLIIGGRLLQLQGVDAAAYAATAEGDRLKSKVITAQRGAITDTDGTRLAYSVETRTVFADPKNIDPDERADLAVFVSKKLGVPYAKVLSAVSSKGRYAVIAKDVDPAKANEIRTSELNGEPLYEKIGDEYTQKRIYPAGTTGGQLVGFISQGSGDGDKPVGSAGVEQSMDAVLAGKEGKLTYEASPSGYMIPAGVQEETPAVPGSTVQLTIDADLQYLLQSAVDEYQKKNPAAAAVSAVALDANTGQVVSMYGTPGYDPGNLGASDGDDIGNPTVSSVLEPGSINKVTTMGPALDQGLITPDSVLDVPGSIPVADVVVNDAWVHDTVPFTATGILAQSSNVGTLMINKELDPNDYFEMLQKFGEGEETGIELPAESPGLLAPRDTWSGSQVGNVPIGQGVSMTPLQMASAYQAIANDGTRIPPRIVKSVIGADGSQTPSTPAKPVEVISSKAAAELRGMLEAVTGEGGTGTKATVPGYRVGGKTGTAQRANPDCGCYEGGGYNHTFVGMAPIEDPQYVVAIAITDPTASVGGSGAAGLFSTVMGQILQSEGVPPSTEASPSYTLIAGQ
ncbi:peptidoglycan D,D-transpeptidase FtsI family protein [Cumulibacter soli]|uniref:peptidoglycan D,D-transpeptidase FtsI family protein n=1 Tax=Cumulibacter soli TaxID=2546344 RepID=UPI001068078F|nr:penicillin-binding protein 2 [Cumulibacter soli]